MDQAWDDSRASHRALYGFEERVQQQEGAKVLSGVQGERFPVYPVQEI